MPRTGQTAIHIGITASLASSSSNTGDAAGDTYTSIENLTGSQFSDILTGTSADNILFGLGGDDTFVFDASSSGSGHDTIGDFTPGRDKIKLDYSAFDSSGSNDFSHWIATHSTQQMNGDLLIDLGVSGPNIDTILLKNVNLASLHINDFILDPGGLVI
jgi:Ca2+-binding RTX toxin-like protein